MKKTLIASTAFAALLTSACGGGESAEAGGDTEVTVTLPFASCLSWYPLYAAEDQGYFKDEGVSAKFEATDGSGGAVAAVLAGKADAAAAAPTAFLDASANGADLTAYYGFYQDSTFQVVAPADSGITEPADLEGKVLGISAPGGGDVTYAKAMLKAEAGLESGKDYTELAIGDGASAATGLKKGDVAAYSASFFDEEIIKAGGMELNVIKGADSAPIVDNLFVSTSEWAKANKDTVEGFGRAVAKGTAWGLEHKDDVITMCGKYAPEETEDLDFAGVIFDRVSALYTLPASAEGKYGSIDSDAFGDYAALLADLGLVASDAGVKNVSNEWVDAWNSEG